MTERGFVRFDTALNTTLEAEEAPLPANLRTAADIDTQIGTATQAALDLKANTSALALKANVADLGTAAAANTVDFATAAQGTLADSAVQPGDLGTAAALDIDTDETLAANSDSLIPTQQAVKAYVDANTGGGGGTGDVVGPASSTAGNFASYDDTTGKLLEDSGVSASDFATAAQGLLADSAVQPSSNPQLTTINLGHATDTTLSRAASGALAVEGVRVAMTGDQSVPIPAGAMKAQTTNGAATGTVEMTTNKNLFVTLDFDASTQEYAQFAIAMPKSWNEGTLHFKAIWSHPSTTTNFGVVWSLAAVALSSDDAGDVAFGTAVTVAGTGGTTNDIYHTAFSSAITVAGSPASEDFVMFQVARVPSNGSDTMAVDARLHSIVLRITTDLGNDG